jgi:hypothetical protein
MQVRSGYAADSWELPPRSAPLFYTAAQTGWVTHRIVQSAGGGVAWISYDEMEPKLVRPPFYQVLPTALTPGQRGPHDTRPPRDQLPPGTEHGQVAGVEWYVVPRPYSPYLYVSVPWPLLMIAFAVLPLARWLWSRRRARAKPGPAFPVVQSGRSKGDIQAVKKGTFTIFKCECPQSCSARGSRVGIGCGALAHCGAMTHCASCRARA